MDKQTLITALIKQDRSRARSQQKTIGVSSLGDCRRKVWHMVQGDEPVNQTLSLPAIMGTAVHAAIEEALNGSGALLEHRVEINGLPPATIDYFDKVTGEVVDWKTITLKNVDYFVTRQKRWQVQVYGYLMQRAGFEVTTVTLVGIPRDGTENDIVVHSEPFDEATALEALAWLEDVRSSTIAPAPERDPVSFCAKYCPFFGELCQGMSKDFAGDPITDEVVEQAADRYVQLNAEIKALELAKDAAKEALVGVAGVTVNGVRVSWSEIAGRQTPDMDIIKGLLDVVPMKQGQPSMRLNVK